MYVSIMYSDLRPLFNPAHGKLTLTLHSYIRKYNMAELTLICMYIYTYVHCKVHSGAYKSW